jgi:hypothetical protein
MPTNREPLHHPTRARITPEMIELFAALTAMSPRERRQRHEEFVTMEKRLMKLCGLNTFCDASVLEPDRRLSPQERERPWYWNWDYSRRLRRALLAAVAQRRAATVM